MKNFNTFFINELNQLNKAQKEAVEATEGPLMVIAGPGTGKTQILAARIGYILNKVELQAFPENILCLTYTDAGSVAMRQRLISFIGTDAHKITISTFHAFCNQLIQQNSGLFGYDDMRMVTPIEELLLMREIIDGLTKDNPLKRWTGDVYYDAKRLLSLFKQMKKEDWSDAFIVNKCDEYLRDILSRPEEFPQFYYTRKYKDKKAGDLKDSAYAIESEKMSKLKAAAALSTQYANLMSQNKLYDFDDMILWVLNALKTNETFSMQLQERYLYILVDEFQDTNESQNEIVNLLCQHWGDNSNVFVVGDDDQSIYRFQGANIQNITSFSSMYQRHLKTILLTENYRSSQGILDAAAALISRNKERITNQIEGLDKHLKANRDDKGLVNIVELPNKGDEVIYIANQIKMDLSQGTAAKEIAVIYRNNNQANELAKYLAFCNIPFTLKRRINILNESFTQKILYVLNYIVGESQDPYSQDEKLFKLLQFDFWQIEDKNEPARFLLLCNHENLGKRDDKTPFRKFIQDKNQHTKSDLFGNNLTAVQRIVAQLDELIVAIHNLPALEFIEQVVYETGIVKYILNHTEKVNYLEQLRSLFDHITSESERNKKTHIHEIIANIELMKQLGLALEIERIIYKGEGLTLTTAHSSKGLEYKHVYMMGNVQKEWSGGSNFGFSLPPNIYIRLGQEFEFEEQRRLFYVAMTRAKTKLCITYHLEDFDAKKQEPCVFINELMESPELIQFSREKIDESISSEFHLAVMQPQAVSPLPEIENPVVQKFIDNLSISATQMASYLECPRQFYFNYVLRVPVAKQKALVFGNAVHKAYENLFKKLVDKNDELQPVSYMLSVFKASMFAQESVFSKPDFKRYLEHGENMITNHYNLYKNSWNKNVISEKRMRAVVYGGIPLTGFIDKIELEGNLARVVDYKTGKPGNSIDKFKTPTTVADREMAKKHELYGGDYWRQAVFYKILLEHDQQKVGNWKFDGAEFDFIEPDEKTGKYVKQQVVITEEDEKFVATLIKQVYTQIKNLEFDEGCGKCEWCNMLK